MDIMQLKVKDIVDIKTRLSGEPVRAVVCEIKEEKNRITLVFRDDMGRNKKDHAYIEDGEIKLSNAYPKDEFLREDDEFISYIDLL